MNATRCWRSAPDLRTRHVDDSIFDELEATVPDDSRVSADSAIQAMLSPVIWERGGPPEGTKRFAMLLTAGDICIGRQVGPPGARLENKSWFAIGFTRYSTGVWEGAATRCQVLAEHETEGLLRFIFNSPARGRSVSRVLRERLT